MRNEQETYADDQATTAAATHTSENIIDHGVEGIGLTEGLWLIVIATVTWIGPSAAFVVTLQSSIDAAFSSPIVIATYPVVDFTPDAGALMVQAHLPVISEQFTRIVITHTTNASAGAFTAYLSDNPQKEQPLS